MNNHSIIGDLSVRASEHSCVLDLKHPQLTSTYHPSRNMRGSHIKTVYSHEGNAKRRVLNCISRIHMVHIKVLQIGLCMYLNILCPNIILFHVFVMGINITQGKMCQVYWLRHKDAKATEQIRCNVELNFIIFTWLNLFLGCDCDSDCGLISV